MNNAEKFAEVFGFDLPIKVFCKNAVDEDCKYCIDLIACESWATAEYVEPTKK